MLLKQECKNTHFEKSVVCRLLALNPSIEIPWTNITLLYRMENVLENNETDQSE